MDDESGTAAPGFEALGLRDELLTALVALGYEEPTPIQRAAIPHLLAGDDLLGQAATGTGKTAAFALPLLHRLTEELRSRSGPVGLILVPTRELAMQVSEATYKYGHGLGARVVPIYGGQHIGRQLDALRRGADIVVASPGRALDHIRRGTLKLDGIQVVVLDEADEMLDMGFAEDIEAILAETPASRQTILFSATLPPRIDAIARRHLRNPVRIQIEAAARETGTAPLVRQSAYVVPRFHKPAALGRILDVEAPTAAIVFCRTRGEVDQLTETLNGRGYRAEALHGGMDQDQRDRVMGRLRNGTAELLVATDVAARGLDIDHLTHVVNYEVPSDADAYVHRIGRVGRAGREGTATTCSVPCWWRACSATAWSVSTGSTRRPRPPPAPNARPCATAQAVRSPVKEPGPRPNASASSCDKSRPARPNSVWIDASSPCEAWAPPGPVCSHTEAPRCTATDRVSVLVSKASRFMGRSEGQAGIIARLAPCPFLLLHCGACAMWLVWPLP